MIHTGTSVYNNLHNDIHEVMYVKSYVHVQHYNNIMIMEALLYFISISGTTKWSVLVDGMFAQWFFCIHAQFWHS